MMGSSIFLIPDGSGNLDGLSTSAIGPVRERDLVAHARRGGDQVDIEFALQALLHDFQVQQPQESAAEAEAQRGRVFGLEAEGAVVQPQFFERIAQQPVLVRFHRIQAREHHRLQRLESRQRLGCRIRVVDDRVADLRVGNGLDVGEQEADFAGGQLIARDRLGRLIADAVHFKHLFAGPQPDLLALAQPAFQHARQNDHAAVGIEPGIENQRAQRRVRRALGRRNQMHHRFQHVVDADALLGAGQNRVAGVQADQLLDLLANPLRLGRRQIDLVDHRNNFQIVMQRQIRVGKRLRFHALRRVHHQQRAFAGLQAARNLVGEIDVARRVDQVELIIQAVFGAVVQPHRVGLDGDAALALQVHRIEHLRHHLALAERARDFEQTIGQRRLAVVDVRNDAEISDSLGIHAYLLLYERGMIEAEPVS